MNDELRASLLFIIHRSAFIVYSAVVYTVIYPQILKRIGESR